MTADDETRQILRDLAAGQRDLAAGQREHSRRFDGLSSRIDDIQGQLVAVTLQTALTSGDVVELKTRLAALDTTKWDETAKTVKRLQGFGTWTRRRGFHVLVAILGGGAGMKALEALLS